MFDMFGSLTISTQRVANARFDNYLSKMTRLTVNARKCNRRSLTMLAALVAITMLGNVVGLVIRYGFTVAGVPIVHNLTGNASASSQIIR
jgi:hypothetical protein